MTLWARWRARRYLRTEGVYVQQIQSWAPSRKERLKLPKIQPLRAVKQNVEQGEFRKRA